MQFNPEDYYDFGPHCRNCHRGSSDCGICHSSDQVSGKAWRDSYTTANAADNSFNPKISWFGSDFTTVDGYSSSNPTEQNNPVMFKHERSVAWINVLGGNWRTSEDTVTADISDYCSNDGFSWPHRTLGWKLLKDDLFGLDFDGTIVAVGETRSTPSSGSGGTYDDNYANAISATHLAGDAAHDIDSVCLDCHNPTVWNATGQSHTDGSGTTDDYNDELILRGLP